MRITLIDNLTIIAHSQHENQNDDSLAKCLVIIPYVQYFSLLLPTHGWSFWTYSDGYLNFFQKASSYFTITPFFEFQSNFIYYPFTILTLILIIGLFIYLSCFSLQAVSDDDKIISQEGKSSTLCSFLLFVIQTLQIPCYKFYIQQIINADENGQINQVVINIITLILYSILIFVGEYIFRQYSFIPFHPMQQKFTILRVTQFLLNLVIIVLQLNNKSHFQHIIALILLHTTFVLKMLNHLYFKPAMPAKNIFHFQLSFLLEALVTLISINIISGNNVFQEQQISIYMLFTASLSYAFSEPLFYFLFQFNQDLMIKQLYQIYELYSYISNITQNSITQYHLKIYQIINDPAYSIFQKNLANQQKSSSMLDYYKLGLFLITEVFVALKEGQKSNYEELHLLFISFLAQIRNKPLVAYVEFKKFKNDLIPKSIYFRLICDRVDQHLQFKVALVQLLYEKKVLSTKVDKRSQYNIEDYYKFFKIEEEFNKKVYDLTQLKIAIWQNQIKGCKSIYDFEKTATPLSYKIIECIWYLRNQKLNFINESFIKQCDNLLILKVASVFHSFILNDYFGSFNCEAKIQELMKQDICQESNFVTKTSIIQDETILMIISIVKQFGNITCSNKSLLANYFGYELADFEHIKNINELMPAFFCASHDVLIQNYIKSAETKLGFDKYITFSLGRNRFLIPQYINIYNRFDVQDDFTLMGCLTKINEANHYLIFDEFGKLIGLTEQLSKILIPQSNIEYFLTNIELFYIYMFVPHIHIYMNSILTNNEIQITQKSVLVYVFQDLREVTKMHSQIVLNYQQSQNYNEKTKVCTNSQQELANLITYPPSQNRLLSETKQPLEQNDELKSLQLSNMDFFKLGYPNLQQPDNQSKQGTVAKENEIIDFLNTLDILSKLMLMCTIKITLASIGKKSQKLQYFILELSEFQEKNIIQEEEKKPKQVEVIPRKPVRRTSKIRQSFISQNQYQKIPKTHEYQIDLMSPVNSIVQKKSLLDKSPANSQILHYVSERRLNLLGVLRKDKSDSFSEEQQSDEIYQVMNQQKEFKSNPGIHIMKSQSSAKSASSGTAAVEIVNKFTKKTTLISGLTIISLIKLLSFMLFFILIFANQAQVSIFNTQAKQFFSDINLPMNLNKYFLNVFSFAWISALEKFEILQNSEYIMKQMTQQRKNMQSTFSNLTNMYSSFIALEEKGFLGQLTIQTEQQNSQQDVDYTYYIDFLEQIGFQLMYSTSNKVYLINLLRFRMNFETIITNNDLVMLSLNSLYHNQQTTMSDSLFKLVVVEIILVDLILIAQIFYWYKIEQYCQKVLLLSCRLTEAAAEEQIQKFRIIGQVIQTIVGQLSWKQQNCHKLCYTNITKKERFKFRQSKVSSSSKQGVQHFIQYTNKNQNSKSFLTIPLNSRIQETSVKFTSKIVFVFTIVLIASLFIIGDYMLFQSQTSTLEPAQQLAMNYIQFSTNLDNSIAVSLLIKTEQQLLLLMQKELPDRKKLIENYILNHNPVSFLNSIYQNNRTLLNEIYNELLASTIVTGEDENYCFTLYNDNICLEFEIEDIPFCERNLTQEEFISLFGHYSKTDNNSDYLNRGIVGITTNFDTFLHQYFEYEYTEFKLNPDIDILQEQIQSQSFTNIVVQHYFDTYLALDAFFDKIQSCTILALEQHMQQYQLYQYLLGLVLILIFIILTCYIVIRVNLRLICLRLLITLLPIEIMLNIHTISLLKILK